MTKFTFPSRYLAFVRLTTGFLFIQVFVRIVLSAENIPSFLGLLKVFFDGVLWDLFSATFLLFPLFFFINFIPEKWLSKIPYSLSSFLMWGILSVLSFVGLCEFTFWNEFHSRFNFIAVDYLIYTNEVLANIRESFPMHLILPGIGVVAFVITYLVNKIPFTGKADIPLKRRSALFAVTIVLQFVFLYGVGPFLEDADSDFHRDQLARNGWLEFYRAFRSNQIDYKNFYATVPLEKAKAFAESKRSHPTSKTIPEINGKPNVVMIVVESLGAKFIGSLGGQPGTTPYLNALTEKSLFFENLYSTGTRTVRGLEALNLSVPPTPGYAVVKRPYHKNLFSLGRTFSHNGYAPIFLYGGRGFFDNMNSFFEGNGFKTIDQASFSKQEVTFSNAWGVCDEDLFKKALKVMEEPLKEPKLLFMLTTSNHRPFTYPDGKIDIPSGQSRIGAVKYTDFAIGKFLEEALKKSWSKNTIFIVVADHSTEGRGQFDLEMADYHIPMWIFSPALIPPQREKRLVSQIDLLPSLIDLLNLKDDSPFFGKSFFQKDFEERAFIGNYQYVGYFKDGTLTTLGPNRKVRSYYYDLSMKSQRDSEDLTNVDEAISFYQYASHLLSTGHFNISEHRGHLTGQKMVELSRIE